MQAERGDPADDRAGADRSEERDVDPRRGERQPLRGEALHERRDGDHEQEAGREPLQDAADRKERPARRGGGEDAGDREDRLEPEVERPLPEALRQVAADQGTERVARVGQPLGDLEPGRPERDRVADLLRHERPRGRHDDVYRREDALTPVHELAKALPLIGILVATLAGAVFVTAVQLMLAYATGVQHASALWAGVNTWPQIVTLLVAAGAFYVLLRTRWLAPFVLVGFLVLTVGVGLLLQLGHASTRTVILVSTALFGFGAGATVSPSLWMAGLSVSAKLVGRVFALVELIRAEGDYIMAPLLRKISVTSAGLAGAAHGIRHALWITLIVSAASIAVCIGVWIIGRRRFERPDLERYVEEGEPAL